MQIKDEVPVDISILLRAANELGIDFQAEISSILLDGKSVDFNVERAMAVIVGTLERIEASAKIRKDAEVLDSLSRGIPHIAEEIIANLDIAETGAQARPEVSNNIEDEGNLTRAGGDGTPVTPSPMFNGHKVPLFERLVPADDIDLWDDNARITVHLDQFQSIHGRKPSEEELQDIMTGRLILAGVPSKEDQFAIASLARNIAMNGLRRPPILDADGTLLDGNRRMTAIKLILSSADFDVVAKKRVSNVMVWQLSEHASDEDIQAVIVSLNFEPDNKQDWPEYVKANKVYEEWEGRIALEGRANVSAARQATIRKDVASHFAREPKDIKRYIKMVGLSREFEEHHTINRKRDEHKVRHKSNRYFQYFDELGKGPNPGGLFHTLNKDETFKRTVFDLLYDGKFANWTKVRKLGSVYEHADAMDTLNAARAEPDIELAQDMIEDAVALAVVTNSKNRKLGANRRIRDFCDFFKKLPLDAFDGKSAGHITADNLALLNETLALANTRSAE